MSYEYCLMWSIPFVTYNSNKEKRYNKDFAICCVSNFGSLISMTLNSMIGRPLLNLRIATCGLYPAYVFVFFFFLVNLCSLMYGLHFIVTVIFYYVICHLYLLSIRLCITVTPKCANSSNKAK